MFAMPADCGHRPRHGDETVPAPLRRAGLRYVRRVGQPAIPGGGGSETLPVLAGETPALRQTNTADWAVGAT